MYLSQEEELVFRRLSEKYLSHEKVKEMRGFIQHGSMDTYSHCVQVARMSFYLNRRLHLSADESALIAGALLHDFYLYDWHDKDPSHRLHGFFHPAKACENAVRYFDIGPLEQHIIRAHMWPLTLRSVPLSREALIVCLADKWCSAAETIRR